MHRRRAYLRAYRCAARAVWRAQRATHRATNARAKSDNISSAVPRAITRVSFCFAGACGTTVPRGGVKRAAAGASARRYRGAVYARIIFSGENQWLRREKLSGNEEENGSIGVKAVKMRNQQMAKMWRKSSAKPSAANMKINNQ
jgi:hypothetical protein